MQRTSRALRVGLIGQKFMGRAHSNAMGQVNRFFELKREVVKQLACGRDEVELKEFAQRWDWNAMSTDWQEAVQDEQVDLVDITTPNFLHVGPALEALLAGKHVACEKPLASTLDEARQMKDAARAAKSLKTFVWFNYRCCPAVAFARQLVKDKRIGRILHARATYLQDWGGPETERTWRFQRKFAGSGAHGDLNAHLVDLVRYLSGESIVEVQGATAKTFYPMRPLPGGAGKKARSDVDDAFAFTASLVKGAVCTFEASRVAGPHQNANTVELNGESGSLRFSFEDMNLLHFYDASDVAGEGGWRRIICTSAGHHPYAENWWPAAHLLGYEHSFTNMLADIVRSLSGEKPETPLPDFADAYETQRVLEAALIAADSRKAVLLSDVG